ncbi:chemotaxis response regulator protein-glutamate methylesterase [Ferrimonas sp. YFM]|uniref:protein-glutamate methylesterase/protein-glutamine glutaminase n=1 Tax=Ferrimonas sp. YFM TaxID=3028878 RepID=UPI0025735EA9|nr:chemotaxis response regulator protein-glutamate methylesterase [Ferrimonas sp. YFM]BDY04048.1 chemotaxis response regulator protein-glutamate methylesterase of group 1 operon [Ferrimonas sp. YFM]
MSIKVLVVDDSSFFRRRVSEIINADPMLEVVGTASNGKEAIEQVRRLRPQVVTMDIEMPQMNGIEAVREIMRTNPVPVLMFSSLTYEGARSTLEALEAGAADFLPKRFEDIANDRANAIALLQQRVKAIASRRSFSAPRPTAAPAPRASATPTRSVTQPSTQFSSARPAAKPSASEVGAPRLPTRPSGKSYKLLAIGTSTGGPVALQKILTQLPADFPLPIVLVQHMPAAFTPAFAQRLDSLCKISVKEAQGGEMLKPGCAYLAPGGKQMLIDGSSRAAKLTIREGGEQLNYKPSVDVTFGSAARIYSGDVLGVILTGMGADGREGCRMLKREGAHIWAQDEASCVVYGMPQAVAAEQISMYSIPLDKMADCILKEVGRR